MIYLDNAAAARPDKETLDFFQKETFHYFANQESAHQYGYRVRNRLREIEENLKILLLSYSSEKDFDPEENFSQVRNNKANLRENSNKYGIIWTESATQAINLLPLLPNLQSSELITTKAEHPALIEALSRLSKTNMLNLHWLGIGRDGLIDLESLCKVLKQCSSRPVLVLHHVNSETGVIQKLVSIAKLIKEIAPNTVFIVDTVQSVGKLCIPWFAADIDYAFISGFKLGLPFGGALFFKKQKNTETFFEELRARRHILSRPSVPVAGALLYRLEILSKNLNYSFEKTLRLNTLFRLKLSRLNNFFEGKKTGKIIFPVNDKITSPYILNFLIRGYQGNVIVRMLSENNIMISAGSACNAETNKPSQTLIAMGFSKNDAFGGLRVSFDEYNNPKEADIFVETLKDVILHY